MLKKLSILLCVLGIGVAGYLSYSKFIGNEIVCGVSTCGIVNSSKYSDLFGVPVAYLGLLFYIGMLVVILINRYKLFLIGSIFGVLFSAYLTYIEMFVIHAWCQWCVFSAWITVALAIVAWRIWVNSKNDMSIEDQKSPSV